jgi:hypothetical protein
MGIIRKMNVFEYHLARIFCKLRLGFDLNHMSTVKSGPFLGMKLCSKGTWAGHGARLIGTYEKELAWIVESVPLLNIQHVIDVGCADGYYICGFLYKYESIHGTAYDLSRRARWCTFSAAKANCILGRMSIEKFFDANKFQAKTDARELLFLDCEGFESQIINEVTIVKFENTAILVECHDHIVPNITSTLADIMQYSHDLVFVQSQERTELDIPENLQNASTPLADMQELRPCVMTWIWAIPKLWKNPTASMKIR